VRKVIVNGELVAAILNRIPLANEEERDILEELIKELYKYSELRNVIKGSNALQIAKQYGLFNLERLLQ
jgi:hypothetical protein